MNGVNVPRDAATARLLGMMQINHPLVLLPVRLETRFVARQADGGGVDFLIRIYPDDIHIDAHERGLTEDEERWGRQFWQNIATAGNDTAKQKSAWRQLLIASTFAEPPGSRACWQISLLPCCAEMAPGRVLRRRTCCRTVGSRLLTTMGGQSSQPGVTRSPIVWRQGHRRRLPQLKSLSTSCNSLRWTWCFWLQQPPCSNVLPGSVTELHDWTPPSCMPRQ